MDGIQQLGLPILGIIAAAGVTFYAVSFLEIREQKSFRDYEDGEESESGGFKYVSSRERRARRKAEKQKPKS